MEPYIMSLSENQIGEGVIPPLLCFTTKNTEVFIFRHDEQDSRDKQKSCKPCLSSQKESHSSLGLQGGGILGSEEVGISLFLSINLFL